MARASSGGLPRVRLPQAQHGRGFSRTDGPWSGMCDSADLTASKKQRKAAMLLNIYPQDAELGGGVIGRPGFQQAGAALGIAGHTRVQTLYQFTRKDGAQFSCAIAGGKFYTFNWSTRAWTEIVTTAQLTAAGITLDPDARCSCVTFSNRLIVSDGIHAPWMWDGTTGGGATALAACPVLYGPPRVYYNKLAGIKAADRLTWVWSEEGDPTTGYDTGAFDDSWTIGQSDPGQLTALLGTNAAMLVWRARSSTWVTGAIDATFKTTGTRDGNETLGTLSPWAVLARDNRVFFLDRYARLHMGGAGGTWEDELWKDSRETLVTVALGSLSSALAVDYAPASLVIVGLVEQGQTDCSMYLVVRVSDEGTEFAGVWRGFTSSALAMLLDGSGVPVLMHGDAAGYVYDHGNPGGGLWDDYVGTAQGAQPILHVLETGALEADTALEKLFDRLDLLLRGASDLHATVQLVGPGSSSPLLNLAVSAGQSKWDVALWDAAVWSPASLELHTDAGFSDLMRWAKVRISHQQAGEQFGVSVLTLSGQVMGAGIEAK